MGVPLTHWSVAQLGNLLRQNEWLLSDSTLRRVLLDAALQPHRQKMWLTSHDDELRAKRDDVLHLYYDTPADEHILSVDEKTSIQALERRYPDLPMVPGRELPRGEDGGLAEGVGVAQPALRGAPEVVVAEMLAVQLDEAAQGVDVSHLVRHRVPARGVVRPGVAGEDHATWAPGDWTFEALLRAGYQVRALMRQSSDASHLARLDIEHAEGDLLDAASLRRACEEVDIVVHIAAPVGSFGEWEHFHEVGVLGTQRLITSGGRSQTPSLRAPSSPICRSGSSSPSACTRARSGGSRRPT